ncbi:PREDICTED: uncharacterized protein LOC108571841 [Habropoda laboriosa]|nr:PREDICTED: uncharacterized protein LOC108571841 [Habropoda laboriosa]
MELREVNRTFDAAEETTELLPSSHRDDNMESYFVEYAVQKEIINRNRCPASRRLLSQTAHLADFNLANGNHQKDTSVGISMIHTSNANWPPSRKREEAKALENLRKRVEQSKLYKASRISDSCGSTSLVLNNDQIRQLDNRPKLLKKILSNRPMSIAHDSNDLETDWRDSEFITECLCWHNVYRQRHDAPPLTMSPQLCEYAQTWANHLAHTNTFYYRNDREVGQNLYCRPGGAVPTDVTGQDVASYWYSAVKQYDFLKEPDILHANVNAGHFTQLIWASSRYFGVGKARSRSGKIIVVANYRPVGNISGQFQNNVLPPLPENINLSSPRQPFAKVFRVASDSPPPTSSSSFVQPLSTDSDRSSVSSAQ